MMNRKFLMILIGLIFVGSGIALTMGAIYNQSEYNAVDVDGIDFNMNVKESYFDNDRLFVVYEYQTIQILKDENGLDLNTYEVVTKENRIPYYLGHYRECLDTNTQEECEMVMINDIYDQAERFRKEEKAKLVKMQTEEIVPVNISAFDFKSLYINYPLYKTGHAYNVGDLLVYENELYEVVQAHVSQDDWNPDNVPALYKVHVLQEEGEVREWVQPTGAQDAYNIGDRVLFNGNTYESLINANVWSPTVYPQGWLLIE